MNRCIDIFVFFFKQKTAYEMRISDWSSDVCSSDLAVGDVDIAAEHRVAVKIEAAETVEEQAGSDLHIFGDRKAIFVARAEQRPFGERVEAEGLGGLQLEPAGRAHQHRIFIPRSKGVMFGKDRKSTRLNSIH